MASVSVKKCVSSFLSVSDKDALRALLMAGISAFLTSLYNTIADGALPSKAEWKAAGMAALAAGIGYLIKQFLSGPKAAETKASNVVTTVNADLTTK
jgi:hypothetical protein